MNPKEHELILSMFVRMYEAIEVVRDTLRSKGIWTEDDEQAFSHAVNGDPQKMLRSLAEAAVNYTESAKRFGVTTGLPEVELPRQP